VPDPEFIVFGKLSCVWCERVKSLLRSRGVAFDERRVDADVENLIELKRRLPDVRTVPQVFRGDVWIGGHDKLVEYLKENET
jgi:glutaredoxin 3